MPPARCGIFSASLRLRKRRSPVWPPSSAPTNSCAVAAVSHRIDSLRPRVDPLERAHGYRVLNREFHGLIHEMARSTVVADIAARTEDLSDFLINTTGVPQPFSAGLDGRHADHEAIRAAVLTGDADAAWKAMEQHILSTVDVIHRERR